MKALVLSDSHGFSDKVRAALEKESDCKYVFFLGDGLRDIKSLVAAYNDKQFILVRGNCDYASDEKTTAYKYIEKNTVVATHGHEYSVKFSLRDLILHAQSVRANVALYGHTHRANSFLDASTGILAVNPGALCLGSYAVVSFSPKGADVEFKSI